MGIIELCYTSRFTIHLLGQMILLADDEGLLGAWFVGQKYALRGFEAMDIAEQPSPILTAAQVWLDAYFAGRKSQSGPPLSPQGTAFQKKVWTLLTRVPSGQTITYGQIAAQLACKSAQAVCGAVGKNPLSIFIPCHRVLGSQGQLTGYAGGLERKCWLLDYEKGVKK